MAETVRWQRVRVRYVVVAAATGYRCRKNGEKWLSTHVLTSAWKISVYNVLPRRQFFMRRNQGTQKGKKKFKSSNDYSPVKIATPAVMFSNTQLASAHRSQPHHHGCPTANNFYRWSRFILIYVMCVEKKNIVCIRIFSWKFTFCIAVRECQKTFYK